MGCSVQPEPVRVVKTQDTSRGWPPEISGRKKRHFSGKYLPLRTKKVPYGGNPGPRRNFSESEKHDASKNHEGPAALAHGAAAIVGTHSASAAAGLYRNGESRIPGEARTQRFMISHPFKFKSDSIDRLIFHTATLQLRVRGFAADEFEIAAGGVEQE